MQFFTNPTTKQRLEEENNYLQEDASSEAIEKLFQELTQVKLEAAEKEASKEKILQSMKKKEFRCPILRTIVFLIKKVRKQYSSNKATSDCCIYS